MLPPLPPLPPVPHVALLLLWQSPVTPMLLPYAISSQVHGRQLNQVPQAQASTLYGGEAESIGSSCHAPSGTFIDQDSHSTHCTYRDMVTMVSRDPPPTTFKLGPVLVLTALQLIVVFRTCPTVISVSFLHARPAVPPGTLSPSPSTMLLLLVPAHDSIFPTIIGEPTQPPYLQYPPFPLVTPQSPPTVIGELPMYNVLRIIILGEWPFEYSQYGQVSPLFTVLGTGILSVLLASSDTFSSLVSNHTCSLDILPSLTTDLVCPTCSLIPAASPTWILKS